MSRYKRDGDAESEYTLIERIGRGAFGSVYRGYVRTRPVHSRVVGVIWARSKRTLAGPHPTHAIPTARPFPLLHLPLDINAPPPCPPTRPSLPTLPTLRSVLFRAHRATQKQWAIKVIKLDEALDEIEEIQREITILSRCSCPNIVGYAGSVVQGSKLLIVMELMVCSAQDLVRGAVQADPGPPASP